MADATTLYHGSVTDTAAIMAACSTNAASTLIIIPESNGTGVLILLQGS